jgi:hypothetical protein
LKPAQGKKFIGPYLEKTHHKIRSGGVPQGVGPELKPQYSPPKKKKLIKFESNNGRDLTK